jgi:hypothetical protein|tara:strand:- start:713 stop:955 length:243 start_codon:yes stop_codon:yes gene_type:complete
MLSIRTKKDLTFVKKSVKLIASENATRDVYESLHKHGDIRNIHIPHSAVYYIRSLIYRDTGVKYTLDHVEQAMKAEGWID